MMNLNKAMIIGNLTRDPEVRNTPSGQTVASFGVATNFVWVDTNGQRQEKVEFHNVVAWRKLGEICGQYLKKGQRVYIEGRLQTREWIGQDGVRRSRTEIIAENMIMLSPPTQIGPKEPEPPLPPEQEIAPAPEVPIIDQEVPSDISPSEPEKTSPQTSEADEEEDIKVENVPF